MWSEVERSGCGPSAGFAAVSGVRREAIASPAHYTKSTGQRAFMLEFNCDALVKREDKDSSSSLERLRRVL